MESKKNYPSSTVMGQKRTSAVPVHTMSQAAETRNRLEKNLVDLFIGKAEILPNDKRADGSPGKIAVRVCRPSGCVDIPADHVCIATGSR